MQAEQRLPEGLAERSRHPPRQHLDVLGPLAQRRQGEGQHVEPVIEVLAELAGGDGPLQVPVARREDSRLADLRLGAADRLEGILTDRDVLYRVVARGLNPNAVRVREVASQPVSACGEDDAVEAAMDLMAAHHVRRLPVRDAAGRVVGWVTLADLARQLLVGSDALQTALRSLAEPAD